MDIAQPEIIDTDLAPQSDRQLLAAFVRRNWWVVLGCTLVALLLAWLYLQSRDEEYKATAVLIIQPQNTQGDTREAQPATPELVRSQLEVLRSQRVLDEAVRQMKLDREPKFVGDAAAPLRPAAAREELRERLEAENDGRSYIITLAASDEAPDKAAALANTVASAYVAAQRQQKVQAVDATRLALSQRLAALRNDTVAAEQAAENYRQRAGLVPLSSIPEDSESYSAATPASREIIEMSRERAALAARDAEASARYHAQRQAISRGRGDSTSEVLSSSVISSLRTQEAELARRESELLARYEANHPLVRPVQAQLSEVRQSILQEISRIQASVASAAGASSQAMRRGDQFMDQLEGKRSRDLAASTRLSQLQREARLKRDTYEEFAAQMQRAGERAGLQLPDVTLVSAATPPVRPSGTPAALVLLLAVAAGFLLGLLLAALRTYLQARKRTTIVHESFAV
ncbi:MAG TPA: Wzz/FepE/Etk N-terminal domain-containing protein [Sphingomicrobium sp.]|nr:Wzz/FepE/Etk N-terminal domain-containing protein [Sphingomicrobium sp.]